MPLSPEAEQAIAPKPRRTWRRRAVVLFVLTLVTTSGGLIYRHYTDAERIRAIAEAYLQEHLRALGKQLCSPRNEALRLFVELLSGSFHSFLRTNH